MENFICNQYREKLVIINTENIEICGWIKGRSDKNAICLHFLPYALNIYRKFAFLISQGSVATCLRWGRYCHMGFVANFTRFFPVVQTFWKWVKIRQSYREFKGGNFLRHCVCMNNSVANNLLRIPTVKWLQYTGEVVKCTSYWCQIFSAFNTPKSLKSVNFWQSYLKNKKVDVFGTVYTCT